MSESARSLLGRRRDGCLSLRRDGAARSGFASWANERGTPQLRTWSRRSQRSQFLMASFALCMRVAQ
eukprot:9475366-Pyramimonas_sp.AAC.1